MILFIRRVHSAIFASAFTKTLFMTLPTANQTLMAWILTIEKKHILRLSRLCFLRHFLFIWASFIPSHISMGLGVGGVGVISLAWE